MIYVIPIGIRALALIICECYSLWSWLHIYDLVLVGYSFFRIVVSSRESRLWKRNHRAIWQWIFLFAVTHPPIPTHETKVFYIWFVHRRKMGIHWKASKYKQTPMLQTRLSFKISSSSNCKIFGATYLCENAFWILKNCQFNKQQRREKNTQHNYGYLLTGWTLLSAFCPYSLQCERKHDILRCSHTSNI